MLQKMLMFLIQIIMNVVVDTQNGKKINYNKYVTTETISCQEKTTNSTATSV